MTDTPVPAAASGCPDDKIDIASAAAVTFTPWDRGVGLTIDGIAKGAAVQIRNAQIALSMMYLTKDELVQQCHDAPDAMRDVIEILDDSAEAFAEIVTLLNSASGRAMVAFASFALSDAEAVA